MAPTRRWAPPRSRGRSASTVPRQTAASTAPARCRHNDAGARATRRSCRSHSARSCVRRSARLNFAPATAAAGIICRARTSSGASPRLAGSAQSASRTASPGFAPGGPSRAARARRSAAAPRQTTTPAWMKQQRSTSARISDRGWCSVQSTATGRPPPPPRRATRPSARASRSAARASRRDVGSSRSSAAGAPSSSAATDARRASPPEQPRCAAGASSSAPRAPRNVPAQASSSSARSTRRTARILSSAGSSAGRRRRAWKRRCSATVSVGGSPESSCSTNASVARRARLPRTRPPTSTAPRCRAPRGARPPMARSSDDFPAPDGPMTQPTSPAGAHPSARFTTSAAPHARPTPRHARSRPSSSLESSSSSSSSAAAKSSAISPSILIPSRRSGLVRKARRLSPSTSARAAARSANWCACSVSTGRRRSKVHADTAGCGRWTWSTTGMSGAAVALS